MDSLKCSNCGYGIHYHDIPDGTEYIFFKWSDWKALEAVDIKANCIEDNEGKYVYAWKCAECGSFAFTDPDHYVYVTHVYAPSEDASYNLKSEGNMEYGVFFEDILWNEIAESGNQMKDILGMYSGYYWLKKNDDAMFLFDDKEMKRCIGRFKRIPVGDK